MNRNGERLKHWMAMDDDKKMEKTAKNRILKNFLYSISGLIGSAVTFPLLIIPNLSMYIVMASIIAGISGLAVFTTFIQKLGREIKDLKSLKRINKCASNPDVRKLNKNELELYNSMFHSSQVSDRVKYPEKKTEKNVIQSEDYIEA